MALVADHYGQIIGDPIEFGLTVSGVDALVTAIDAAVERAAAGSVRVGIEAAGHYHQALAARCGTRVSTSSSSTPIR
jgi:hypothetical protein